MKSITEDTPTVHRDGEELPVTEVYTLCDNCGIPSVDYGYCERCDLARLQNAVENQNTEKIRSILEERIYNQTRGHKAEATWRENKATIWTTNRFNMDAEEFIRLIDRELRISIGTGYCEDEEFQKYCVIRW